MPHAEHRSQVSQGKWITQVICHLSSHCWAANHLWARSLACCHLLSSVSSISMAPWVAHARNIRKQCMNSYISTLNPLRTDIKAQPQVLSNYNPTVLVMISVVTIVCTSGHRTVVWSSGTSIYQLALPKWFQFIGHGGRPSVPNVPTVWTVTHQLLLWQHTCVATICQRLLSN